MHPKIYIDIYLYIIVFQQFGAGICASAVTPPYTDAVAVTISIMYYYTHMNIFIQNTKYSQLIPRMSKYYWFDCEALNIYFNSGLVYSSGNIIVSCVGLLQCMHFTIWIITSSFVDTYMYINIIFFLFIFRGNAMCLPLVGAQLEANAYACT